MRFLVDAQLPPRLCRWLADKGHESIHVMDWEGGTTMPDAQGPPVPWRSRNRRKLGRTRIGADARRLRPYPVLIRVYPRSSVSHLPLCKGATQRTLAW